MSNVHNDIMARVAVLEANDRHGQEHRKTVDDAIMRMSKDIRDIRDVIIGSNLDKIPGRVDKLEKSRWIGHGISAGIGGGSAISLYKILTFFGLVAR